MIALAIAAAAAVAKPHAVLTVPPEHRLVEGVATDGSTIFVSSVLDRQILACATRCRTIATLPQGLHPLGIAWDWGRHLLWVAADCPDVAGIAKCEQGALVAINRNGALRGHWSVPAKMAFHPGDVSVSQSGVFVSDSQNGLIWGLLPRRPKLKAVNRPGDGKSAQGTALAPSGTELIVADYERGIGRLDLKATATTWLPRQDGKPPVGTDGLVRCSGYYVGVYNGGAAQSRLWKFEVQPRGVQRTELVENLTLDDPTQIAFDGKRLLVVSESGWEGLGKGEMTRKTGAKILAIPLTSGCQPI